MRILFFLSLSITLFLTACNQQPAAVETQAPKDPNQAVADADTSANQPRTNLWKNRACDLVTDTELAQLFGVDAKRDVLNTRTLPEQAFCLRKWKKTDWKERETSNEKPGANWLDPENSLIIQVFGYTTNDNSRQQFAALKRDRRDTYEEDVNDLGDEAIWSTSTLTLLVRKGHLVLSGAANLLDTPHDNLAKASEAARIALKKM
jgi:hypothetical protein